MQVDWWLQPEDVFGHFFSGISQVMAVIDLGQFAKSDFMTDISCPHIKQFFWLVVRIYFYFLLVQGVPKKT